MDRGGDVFGALAWGLRRYAWVVALSVLLVGALVPFALSRSADVYEAKAVLAPGTALEIPSLDSLPKTAETVFDSGAVEDSAREVLGLPATTEVIPEYVELVAEQDNINFEVLARADDPDVAAELANAAAVTFQLDLNLTSDAVGSYIVLRQAEPPAEPEPKIAGGFLALVLAVLAGLLLGVALVALLVVLRRPVLDAGSAAQATGAPVLGRVTLPRGHGEVDERDAHGLGSLCRRLLSGGGPPVILLVSPGKATSLRHRLTEVMVPLLGRNRTVHLSRGDEQDPQSDWGASGRRGVRRTRAPGTGRTDVVLVDGPSAEQRADRPDSALTVFVAPEGMGFNALRRAAAEHLDGEPGGVVLVGTRGRVGRRGGPRATDSSGYAATRTDDERPEIFDDPDERAS